jgi:hypothetical protein
MDSATCKLIETIFNALNNGKCIAGIFFNLTKAFDCINHELTIGQEIGILWC